MSAEESSRLFSKITHGVYVIGVASKEAANKAVHSTEGLNAFTASGVMHVSYNPLLLALSINHQHSSYKLLRDSNICTVNVIPSNRRDLAKHFGLAKPKTKSKLDGIRWKKAENGAPIIAECLAFFECSALSYTDGGDHVVVVLKVTKGGYLCDESAKPLRYDEIPGLDNSVELYSKL